MSVEKKPEAKSLWQHHSGRVYRVLFIANDVPDPKPKYPPTVVYEGTYNGKRWSRDLSDWHRRMTPFVPLGHVLEAPATRPEREAQEAVAWIIHDREDEYHGRGSDTVRFSPLLPEEEDAGLTASPLYREPPDAAATIARLQRERAAAIGLLDGQAHIIKTLETKASRLRGALKAAKAEEREACAQIAASVASRCAERGVTMAKSRTGKDKARAGHRASVEIELAIRARAETISEVD